MHKATIRKVTGPYLRRVALFYVQRYATTTSRLRHILRQRVERSFQFYGDDEHPEGGRDFFSDFIEQIIEEFVKSSYVNDQQFAGSRVRRLLESGHSLLYIQKKLQLGGLKTEDVEIAISRALEERNASNEETDARAAWKLAHKKRLGPFRTDPASRASNRNRDLAALARRGFGPGLAFHIIDSDEIPDLFNLD